MNHNDLLLEAFGRIKGTVHAVLDGLTAQDLAARPQHTGNSIAWLVWHLTRVQDDHISDVAGQEQAWTAAEWAEQFALPFDVSATGYGFDSAEVSAVKVDSPVLLEGYYDAVHDRTVEFLRSMSEEDLDRVVDANWDPPVTLGVRLVSVLDDCLEHAGQAAYVRGLVKPSS